MNLQEIKELQTSIDVAIQPSKEVVSVDTSFFQMVSAAPLEDLVSVLGAKIGHAVFDICPVLNFSHPDLGEVVSLYFQDTVSQGIQVATFVRKNGLMAIGKHLPKMLKGEVNDAEESILSIRASARLLQQGERTAARAIKKSQSVDLGNAYKKGRSIWDNTPDNFKLYIRNSVFYREELTKWEKQAERLRQLNCASMYAEMENVISTFRSNFGETHYGFHRITMTNAALILAKMHGCAWVKWGSGSILQISKTKLQVFGVASVKEDFYFYSPVAYPAEQREAAKPFVELLDNYPESRGNPIFDYYIVLVPEFKDQSDNFQGVVAALLGERDGKCYFISYLLS